MSSPDDMSPLQLPTEKTPMKIEEPPDPDSPSSEEDDSDGQPDQPDGEK